MNAPLAECERRDPKQLYKQAREGKIPNFTGIDSPYEAPLAPDLELRTDREPLEESLEKLTRLALGLARPAEHGSGAAGETYEPRPRNGLSCRRRARATRSCSPSRPSGCSREADVVVYDSLVSAEILARGPPGVRAHVRRQEGRLRLQAPVRDRRDPRCEGARGKEGRPPEGRRSLHLRPGRGGGRGPRRGRHPL